MTHRDPFGRRPVLAGFGSGAPPNDVLWLLGVVFVTFSLQFFTATKWLIDLLRLTPQVWQAGRVWQLVTYPFAGTGGASVWILLELFILFWFARDVYALLGRRRFWQLLVMVSLLAAVGAALVHLLGGALGLPSQNPFLLMQGQRMLMVILVAAFGTLRQNATILLFFVLPIQAKYFLGLEILFAFIAFLATKDLAGFLGLCLAVGLTWGLLRAGSLGRLLREGQLRFEKLLIQQKMQRMRRKRFRVVKGGGAKGKTPPSIN